VIVTEAPPVSIPPTTSPASPARPATARAPKSRGIAWPRPTVPRISARAAYALSLLLRPSKLWYAVALQLESHSRLYRLFTAAEKVVKGRLFGCKMCAQCAMPSTAYTCPMTCPKQLRNGPCGGVSPAGKCEVYPDLQCVWVTAYERADREHRVSDLRRLQRPIDQRRWGQSSWVNYWLGRDDDLWTDDDGLYELPVLTRESDAAARSKRAA
jgi:hypothetical protein